MTNRVNANEILNGRFGAAAGFAWFTAFGFSFYFYFSGSRGVGGSSA